MLNATNVTPLGASISLLENVGFIDVVLPFLLIFAITYGSLKKSKILGDMDSMYIVISFVIALSVTITATVVGVIKFFLPLFGLVLLIIVSFLVILSLFFGEASKVVENKLVKNISSIVIVLVLLFIIILAIMNVLFMVGVLKQPTAEESEQFLSLLSNVIVSVVFIITVFTIIYLTSKQGNN